MSETSPRLLVVQSTSGITVTVREGEVPAIPLIGESIDCQDISLIVNCLRSGCPAVQAVLNEDYAERLFAKMSSWLDMLELPGEHFVSEFRPPDSPILLITRQIDQ